MEPLIQASIAIYVSLYHFCKDGAVCFQSYDFLFFMDAFTAVRTFICMLNLISIYFLVLMIENAEM